MQNEPRPGDELDRNAVTRVLAGDSNAFAGLYRRHLSGIRAIGYRFFRGTALARGITDIDDFVQDVFIKAFTALDSYNGTGQFRSWLQRIAYTTALNCRRDADPEEPTDPNVIDAIVPAPESTDPSRSCLVRDAVRTVADVLSALPAAYARAVELFYVFNLKYREISDITEIPVGTLKAQVHRARKMIARLVDPALLEAFA